MKRLSVLLSLLLLSSYANAASLLTVKFTLSSDQAKCNYMFFSQNNEVRYEANPVSLGHCPRTIDVSKSTVKSLNVTFPITNVPIDGKMQTCTVRVNRLSDNSPYIYTFVNSHRDCANVVKVNL